MTRILKYLNNITTEKYFSPIILFIIIFFIIVLRRPDILFNAQPWAEDGSIWMSDIYNNGFWRSLILPQNGYYQTISRLAYGFGLLFGISNAALISNLIAISIRCFLVLFLLSKRMSFIDIKYRIVIVFYFLFMPNLSEGYVNITNAHWYLSLYLMLVVLAEEPCSKIWKIHDFIILIISSLSGPFVLFILPCLFIKRVYQRGSIVEAIRNINVFDLIMVICVLIQLICVLISSDSTRSSASLGANLFLFINLFCNKIFASTFFPNYLVEVIAHKTVFNVFVFVVIVVLIAYFFFNSSWRFKISFIFPILMISFALAKPMISLDQPQWPVLLNPGVGERYFFITNFAFFCFIIFLIDKLRNKSTFILICFTIIISPCLLFTSLSINPVGEFGYKEDIKKFESMPVGEKMDIRIAPYGWYMTLKKK